MSNESRPFGFRAVQNRSGAPYVGKERGVIFVTGDATAAFIGDMLKFTGASQLGRDGKTYSVVTVASAADTRLAGAMQRVDFDDGSDGFIGFRKASTEKIAYIPQDRNTLYVVQDDSDGGALSADSVEANIDFVAGAGGSTVTNQSSMRLDTSTVSTTDALPLRIVEPDATQDNEVGVNFALWLVTINQDAYSSKTGLA